MILCLAGLGNVGIEYLNTRHNIGFNVINTIKEYLSVSQEVHKFSSIISSVNYKDNTLLLVRPQTYMNLSGNAICQIKKFYKLQNDQIFVFHDDLDLELGRVRVKIGGGNAGHNGLKSIDEMIGNDFIRIRIGIGRPQLKSEIHNYVLNNASADEMIFLNKKFHNICNNLDFLLAKQFSTLLSNI